MTNLIYTSYFDRAKDFNKDKYCLIGIAGKSPEGWTGEEYKRLAPSWSIWSQWHEAMELAQKSSTRKEDEDLACQIYTDRFKTEILAKRNPQEVLDDIRNIAKDKIPVLCCYEVPGKFCHRHLVKNWLLDYSKAMDENDAGYDNDIVVMEYGEIQENIGCCNGCANLVVRDGKPGCMDSQEITKSMEKAMMRMIKLYAEWYKVGLNSEMFLEDCKWFEYHYMNAKRLFGEYKKDKMFEITVDGKTRQFCEYREGNGCSGCLGSKPPTPLKGGIFLAV